MAQRLHILGICGTFMGGLALLARESGFEVSGCDANVYPPMSDQLAAAGIDLIEGYDPATLPDDAMIVIGNALSRGNPVVEAVLNRGLPYQSGPQWLAENVLNNRWVLGVSGTHGKTTTSSILAWLLEDAGYEPGFLIGGVPKNFGISARLGSGDFFVVEADEYDSAFFDKRSKFIHYRPRTLIINNLEFDHADIFDDLAAIQRQFHHLVRCVPGDGRIIIPQGTKTIDDTLAMGCWSSTESVAVGGEGDWRVELTVDDGTCWSVQDPSNTTTSVEWTMRGEHNVANALAAFAAARHVGVPTAQSAMSLAAFSGVKRRLDTVGIEAGVSVIDDFAHHPTAIQKTIGAVRALAGSGRVLAVIEPRSNTMRLGEHREALAPSTNDADQVFWFQPPGLDWSLDDVVANSTVPAQINHSIEELIASLVDQSTSGDVIVIMSNGGFGGIHHRLLSALREADS